MEYVKELLGFLFIIVGNAVLLTRWVNNSLYVLDMKIQEERQARSEYFDRRVEDLRKEIVTTRTKYHETKEAVAAFELRIEQRLAGYPTKADMRDLLSPLVAKVDTIHDELVRSGIKSTVIQRGSTHGA